MGPALLAALPLAPALLVAPTTVLLLAQAVLAPTQVLATALLATQVLGELATASSSRAAIKKWGRLRVNRL
jgi:hypothetical protein